MAQLTLDDEVGGNGHMWDFTIGGVLRRATLLLRAHVGLFVLLTLLLVAMPQVIWTALLHDATSARPGWAAAGSLRYWVGGTFLQAIVTRVAIDDLSRRVPTIGALAGAAVRYFVPIVVISVLSAIAVAFASLLLVVPGLMLLCRWYLTLPVEVAERSGIFASFTRSAELTYGVRWRVLGLTLLVGLIGLVVAIVFGFGGGFIGGLSHNRWPTLAGQAVGTAFFQLFAALANTAAYLSLREVKEGTLSEDLVAAFE